MKELKKKERRQKQRKKEKYEEINVKVKFTIEQATKAQRGRRGIALLFL
jgi:hypothetical protein